MLAENAIAIFNGYIKAAHEQVGGLHRLSILTCAQIILVYHTLHMANGP